MGGHDVLKLYFKCSKINFLEILGIKIFGPNSSYLILKAVNFWGFWGPSEMKGNDFKENKVIPLIFKQFWSRSHLNKLDRLPHKTSNMYIVCTYFVDSWNRKNCLKDDKVVFLLQTLQRISIILTTSVWVKLPTLTDILPLQLPYLQNRLWSSCSGFNDWSHLLFQLEFCWNCLRTLGEFFYLAEKVRRGRIWSEVCRQKWDLLYNCSRSSWYAYT